MSVTLDRLQALRRQSGVPTPAAATPAAVEEHDPLQDQLTRLRSLLRVKRGPVPSVAPATDRMIPGTEISPGLWLQEECLTFDGAWPCALDGTFDRRDPIPTRDLLFFDTETTGLAGGTGTRAFMIGAADVTSAGLHIAIAAIKSNQRRRKPLKAINCNAINWQW